MGHFRRVFSFCRRNIGATESCLPLRKSWVRCYGTCTRARAVSIPQTTGPIAPKFGMSLESNELGSSHTLMCVGGGSLCTWYFVINGLNGVLGRIDYKDHFVPSINQSPSTWGVSSISSSVISHSCSSLNFTHNRYMELADLALVQWPALQRGLTPKQALVSTCMTWIRRKERTY